MLPDRWDLGSAARWDTCTCPLPTAAWASSPSPERLPGSEQGTRTGLSVTGRGRRLQSCLLILLATTVIKACPGSREGDMDPPLDLEGQRLHRCVHNHDTMFDTLDNPGFLPFVLARGWSLVDSSMSAVTAVVTQHGFAPRCEESAVGTSLRALHGTPALAVIS